MMIFHLCGARIEIHAEFVISFTRLGCARGARAVAPAVRARGRHDVVALKLLACAWRRVA